MTTDLQPVRSQFVTTLAWIFICLTGFTTFTSIAQNVMIAFVFPIDQIQAAARSAPNQQAMSPMAGFIVKWLFGAFAVASTLMFVTSIALLKRKNWARLVFVGFLVFSIAWFAVGLVFQYFAVSSMSAFQHDVPSDFHSDFGLIAKAIFAFSVIMAIGLDVLFVWLIRRLTSLEIIREFASTPR